MIGRMQFRSLLESHNGDALAMSRRVLHLAGLTNEQGQRYLGANRVRELRNPLDAGGRSEQRLRLEEVSIRGLAEALMGEDAVERWLKPDAVRELQEAGTAAVNATQFSNINAFTALTTGLLEASILEGYQNPEFIGDMLAPPEPTRQFEGKKSIGVSRIGDEAEERQPGMPTKRVKIGERWINQPRTVENALSIEVTQEAVYLDLTGQLTEEANDLGTWLGYRKELRIIDAFIGVNNSYNFMGNAYNTWISGGYYDNDISGNELLTTENLLKAEIKFRDMKDPQTNTRILVQPNTMLVQREYLDKATAVTQQQNVTYREQPTPGAGVIQRYTDGPSVFRSRNYNIVESALVFERINAATGLNQSAANAAKYWWLFDKNGFMRYAQNWDITPQSAAPGQLDMIDRGVVLYVKAHERGIPWVKEPRKGVRCRG